MFSQIPLHCGNDLRRKTVISIEESTVNFCTLGTVGIWLEGIVSIFNPIGSVIRPSESNNNVIGDIIVGNESKSTFDEIREDSYWLINTRESLTSRSASPILKVGLITKSGACIIHNRFA
jgi:hypothetical protein